eukprot:m.106975 g.106975  ORF g.106975 m.106975 type:complete len:275 (-) comp27763_c1_seq1:98-922(-)
MMHMQRDGDIGVVPLAPANSIIKEQDTTSRGSQLDSVLQQLATLLERSQADLSYVSRKLQSEYATKYSDVTHQHLNPNTSIARIESLRNQLSELSELSLDVEQRKKTLSAVLQSKAKSTCETVRALETKCMISDSDPYDESALGELGVVRGEEQESTPQHNEIDDIVEDVAPVVEVPTRSKKNFIPVSKEEFFSVSELVRGRIKITDVNLVYTTLYEYFQKGGKSNSKPITTREMAKLGLKITGQSGEAKLKVLRRLDLISISNSDSSVSLCYK